MAYLSHSLGRSSSSGHVASLIDGVRVKVTEQFQPPKKVTLPLNFELGNPTEVLFMEYDFTLEEKVLEWTANQRKAVKALDKVETTKVGDVIEQFAQATPQGEEQAEVPKSVDSTQLPDSQVVSPESASSATLENGSAYEVPEELEETAASEATGRKVPNGSINQGVNNTAEQGVASGKDVKLTNPSFYQNMNSSIMTPTPIVAAKASAMSQTAPKATINVADFERESDPFDNLELQVLNDMEELNKVLSGTQNQVSQAASVAQKENFASSAQNPSDLSAVQASKAVGAQSTQAFSAQDYRQPGAAFTNGANDLKNVQYPDVGLLGGSNYSTSNPFMYAQQQQQVASQQTIGYYKQDNNVQAGPATSHFSPNVMSMPANNTTMQQPQVNKSPLPAVPGSQYLVQQDPFRQQQQQQENLQQHSSQPQPNNQSNPSSSALTMDFVKGSALFSTKALKTGKVSNPPPNQYSRYSVDHTSNGYVNPASRMVSSGSSSRPEYPAAPRGLRSARSTPDISQLLQDESRVTPSFPTSHTPPPYPTRSKSPPARPSTGQSWNPYSPLPVTTPPRPGSSSRSPVGASRSPSTPESACSSAASPSSPGPHLPDPYYALSTEAQRFVDTLTVMGFPRGRTARAVQHIGQDDKQVVDYLCLVNRLSDQGFNPDDAETASQLFDRKEDEVKQYLKLLGQFQELGFEKAKAKEALLKCKLDEEKTLDLLTGT